MGIGNGSDSSNTGTLINKIVVLWPLNSIRLNATIGIINWVRPSSISSLVNCAEIWILFSFCITSNKLLGSRIVDEIYLIKCVYHKHDSVFFI